MNVDLDIEKLIALKMTSTEYCILNLLFNQKYEILLELFTLELIKEEDLKRLQKLGYLKLLYKDEVDFKQITLREKANDLFNVNSSDKFNALWVMYPIKVPDGKGGSRVLKGKNLDSHNAKVSKELFLKIIKGKPLMSEQMIKGLTKQLVTMRGSLQFMQQFDTWMRQHTWEKYLDLEDEKTEDSFRERL